MMIPNVGPIFREYIANTLDIPVFPVKPATRPPKCVVMQLIPAGAHVAASGSSGEKAREFAWRRFLIHCWDSTDNTGYSGDAAVELGERVRQAMVNSIKAGLGVHLVRVPGEPGQYNDPTEATPRVQLMVDVLMKSVVRQQ